MITVRCMCHCCFGDCLMLLLLCAFLDSVLSISSVLGDLWGAHLLQAAGRGAAVLGCWLTGLAPKCSDILSASRPIKSGMILLKCHQSLEVTVSHYRVGCSALLSRQMLVLLGSHLNGMMTMPCTHTHTHAHKPVRESSRHTDFRDNDFIHHSGSPQKQKEASGMDKAKSVFTRGQETGLQLTSWRHCCKVAAVYAEAKWGHEEQVCRQDRRVKWWTEVRTRWGHFAVKWGITVLNHLMCHLCPSCLFHQ